MNNEFVDWDDIDPAHLHDLLGEYTDEEEVIEIETSGSENDDDLGDGDLPIENMQPNAKKSRANVGRLISIYICPVCQKEYRSASGFRGHVSKKHNKPELKGNNFKISLLKNRKSLWLTWIRLGQFDQALSPINYQPIDESPHFVHIFLFLFDQSTNQWMCFSTYPIINCNKLKKIWLKYQFIIEFILHFHSCVRFQYCKILNSLLNLCCNFLFSFQRISTCRTRARR